jgi:hypothetical protein
MKSEAMLAAGYAVFLLASAGLLECLSAHTHRRSLRYRTAGFEYDADHDHWRCPEGEHLWPHELDDERRLMRYRAKAHVCNGCPRKEACTDSSQGREIVRPLDPWPHSEAGRFHRAVSLVLVGLALLVLVVGGVRNHAPREAVALLGLLVVALLAGWLLARDLRAHPANFPEPAASHGLRLEASSRPAFAPVATSSPAGAEAVRDARPSPGLTETGAVGRQGV